MSKDPVISVILPCHSETKWLVRAARSVFMQISPPPYELIIVIDKAASDTTAAVVELLAEAPAGVRVQPITVDAGDLGTSRNFGVAAARGRFVSFLDSDDLIGCTFLRDMFEAARRYDHDNFVLHPRFSCMFGASNFWHYHVGSDEPSFSAKDMVQYNPWSALAFAPRELLLKTPYFKAGDIWGYEDWVWNTTTYGNGAIHQCVDGAVQFIRMKLNESSLAARMTVKKLSIPRMPLFDRRNLLDAQHEPIITMPPPEIHKQAMFVHHKVGEYRVNLNQEMPIRAYPRQVIFDDQAWLCDQIGESKHVILVHELKPGGAEKYAIDWAEALQQKGLAPVIIETAPGASPWQERASSVAKVIRWHKRRSLQPPEVAYAIQRAMIQCELESLFVCNSELGWALIHENPAALAKRVIAASFSVFPLNGYTSCPPFYMERQPDNVSVLTDNDFHAEKLRGYGTQRVVTVPPRCNYRGVSKLRQTKDDRLRLLWAGRGSQEKAPHLPVFIAATMPEVDVHIWGEVQPIINALPNVHYRGAFDGFESIDGAYDAYLLTSQFEGMPNTALEAVAAGLPVIASNVGDVRKIAAAVFPAPTGPDQQKNTEVACKAIAGFVAARDKYDHAGATALVDGWRDSFADSVAKLVS